jgi:hypothetical protein
MFSTANFLSLHFYRHHRFWFFLTHASNKTAFPDFPKIFPKEDFPTSTTESTSRKHKSFHVEKSFPLRDLSLLHLILPKNIRSLLSLLHDVCLGFAPLFLYRHWLPKQFI